MYKRKVLVGINFSEASAAVLDAAIEQCGDGELHAMCVLDERGHVNDARGGPHGREPAMAPEDAGFALRQMMAAHLSKRGKPRTYAHVSVGAPATRLADAADELDVDLVVVGGAAPRSSLKRLLAGSVADRLLRVAPCPVLVVRGSAVSATVPEPEPECAACQAVRQASGGDDWWCEAHSASGRRSRGYQSHLDFGTHATPLW